MSTTPFVLAALALCGPANAAPQASLDPGPRPVAPARVLHSPDLPELGPAMRLADDREPIASPAPLSDVLPRQGSAVYEVGPEGDRLVRPADEDPYYLGFAGGLHRPPAGERLDPVLFAASRAELQEGRPARTYAFALLEHRITQERIGALEALGVSVLGLHPSNCLKLALPIELTEAVASHPEVRWLGVARPEQKFHPALAAQRAQALPGETLALIVNVFESDLGSASIEESFGRAELLDAGGSPRMAAPSVHPRRVHSNGWQQRALEGLGVEVLEWSESAHAFRARALPGTLESLAAQDFVLFLELDVPKAPLHDKSMPLVYADTGRYYFNGGTTASIVAGQIDSGFDHAHAGLNHVNGWGWELGGSGGPWFDPCEHGSHVAGTLLGSGANQWQYRGTAPGLGWGGNGRFYNIKTSNACTGWNFSLQTAVNILRTPVTDGGGAVTQPPHVVNNSWGSSGGGPWFGSEYEARLIDAEVYSQAQMYVFANGNDGPLFGTTSLTASAKNAFSVGAVDTHWFSGGSPPGLASATSSRGPTADGRWKPNIAAPGSVIVSVDANTPSGYVGKSGTSMAAPHVSGIAAQLMDRHAFLRRVPERLQSLMMATAMPRDGQLLTSPNDAHLSVYGAGRVEAARAAFGTTQTGWSNWGGWLPANNYTWADVTILPGCTRLVVCMTYVEPAASSGASIALLSNFDLILDQPPIDPNFNVGDYYAHQSSVDNTEIRILDNPTPGTWRWKIWPTNAPQGVYYGITAAVVYGDTTPNLVVTTTPAKTFLKQYEQTDVTVRVAVPTFIASSVVIEPSYTGFGGAFVTSIRKFLNDGIQVDLPGGANVPVLLGDIYHDNYREATWRTYWSTEGQWGFIANARGDNAATVSHMGVVTVDSTPPSAPPNLVSLNHAPDVWSNGTQALFQWEASSDNLAGVAGYSVALGQGAPVAPSGTVDTAGLSSAPVLFASDLGWYLDVAAVDHCGNVSASTSVGPLLIDDVPPEEITGLDSTSHVLGLPACASYVTLQWDVPADVHSGVAGYALLWDDQPTSDPGSAITHPENWAVDYLYVNPGVPQYVHVAAIDHAGNVGPAAHWGPLYVEGEAAQPYCTARTDSKGCTPYVVWSGCPSVGGGDDFVVAAYGVRAEVQGAMLWSLQRSPLSGSGVGSSPFGSNGCTLRPQVVRLGSSNGTAGSCDGALGFFADHTWLAANGLTPGTTVYVQFIYADGAEQGYSDALEFTITL